MKYFVAFNLVLAEISLLMASFSCGTLKKTHCFVISQLQSKLIIEFNL